MRLAGLISVRGAAWCLYLCAALFGHGLAAAQDEPSRYGKSLVRSYELPAELLDQYNLVAHGGAGGRTETLAGIPAWTGSEFRTAAGAGPYTLVIRMLGAAIESDDVAARWQLGWGSTPGVVPVLGEPGARKGEFLQLVLASESAALEEGRLVPLSLRLGDVRNMRLERVRVEVWSGAGETSWLDWLRDWWKLLATAGVWVALYFYWRHDRRKTAAADVQAGGAVPENLPDTTAAEATSRADEE